MTIQLFLQLFGALSFAYMMSVFAVSGPSDEDYDWKEIDRQNEESYE